MGSSGEEHVSRRQRNPGVQGHASHGRNEGVLSSGSSQQPVRKDASIILQSTRHMNKEYSTASDTRRLSSGVLLTPVKY